MGLITKRRPVLALIAAVLVTVVGALIMGTSLRVSKGPSGQSARRLADVSADAWTLLSEKTAFFGHQSVGHNMVEGIRDVIDAQGIPRLVIKETTAADSVDGGMLVHARVGRNRDPRSKIAEFRRIMEEGLGEKVDIAFFKFCYVDIVSDSDPKAILDVYCDTMDALKARFPSVLFLHVTVPLRAPSDTAKGVLKTHIKRILGRSSVLDDNRVRARYNELLRERFSGKEPLFDLAEYEALGLDGLRHWVRWKGDDVPVLVRSYTDDGGHLNATGRRHIAEQLLIQLQDIAKSQSCPLLGMEPSRGVESEAIQGKSTTRVRGDI